jgi:hypothetical protein
MRGEVGRRATGYTLDLGPDATAAHDGRPAILATAVVNAALVDLAIRRPPPLTPEEAVFDQVMKRVGPAFSSLGKAVAGSDAAAAADNATTLGAAFTEAEAFWKARGTADALAWTRGARTHVTALERAGSYRLRSGAALPPSTASAHALIRAARARRRLARRPSATSERHAVPVAPRPDTPALRLHEVFTIARPRPVPPVARCREGSAR